MLRSALAALIAAAAVAAVDGTAVAQPAPLHGSIDGGLACSRNKSFGQLNGGGVGKEGCGGTGAVEIGRTGAPVWGVFDHWALRGRFTQFEDDHVVAGPVALTMKDRRLVLDAELGMKFNLVNFFGGTTRLVAGLRYASWRGNLTTDSGATFQEFEHMTHGIGPRIGLRSMMPLRDSWMLESRSGVSALYSRREFEERNNGAFIDSGADHTWVMNFESNTALSYMLDGSESGRVISVGLFSEYWFKQAESQLGGERNRHSWGPSVRFRMPLAQ